ncbi:MAG TPA: SH3 domain-containing protein [Candidatus Acidoferrum sp.]|nr:SH3 domain-containing protein [Candidatus Acidoferrum sp.]
MRKVLIGFMVVLVVSLTLYIRLRRPSSRREVAYAGNREVTLWSTTAQVREPVATAKYGDRLDVLGRFEDQVQVQTASGSVGWINEADLLSADLWQRANDLEALARKSPVEARGRTRAISNLHVEAGRESPRIRQLSKGLPVDLFERKVVDVPVAPGGAAAEEKNPPTGSTLDGKAPSAKKEDWWLVRAHLPDQTFATGWILGRFVDLDVPAPLPDYASAAAMHIVAWFELNRVMDPSAGSKPQYLVVGSRGPEGQTCDFTMLRVFTWGARKQRYETAYVESDVCGKLPVTLNGPSAPSGDVTFSFEDFSHEAVEERKYRMERTVVRRVREGESVSRKRTHARG